MAKNTCSVEECELPARTRGWCVKHYARWRKHGDVTVVKYVGPTPRGRKCQLDGCERPHRKFGYCDMHYRRVGAGTIDDPRPSRKQKTLRDGWLVHGNGGGVGLHGYRIIVVPGHPNAYKNGTIQEHRFVMSCHLGRPLHSDESVHHKNGDKLDNRIENLELKTRYHGKGQSVSDRISDAIYVLERYAPELLAEKSLRAVA